MGEPIDMIVPLLREMRPEMNTRFDRVDTQSDIVERRLKGLEETLVTFRQAPTADTLLSKPLTGEFEERIEILERKVRELETHK